MPPEVVRDVTSSSAVSEPESGNSRVPWPTTTGKVNRRVFGNVDVAGLSMSSRRGPFQRTAGGAATPRADSQSPLQIGPQDAIARAIAASNASGRSSQGKWPFTLVSNCFHPPVVRSSVATAG